MRIFSYFKQKLTHLIAHLKYLASFILIVFLASCSTEKNTMMSRNYHNLTAYYNVYFNGREAYRSGMNRIEMSYVDDYSRRLEVFKYGDEAISKTIYPDMDKSIAKASKMIKQHSITKKPKRKKGKLTKSEREFYNKSEYNAFVDDAYLLMGKAHFHKHDFSQAQQNFDYIIKEFGTEKLKYEAYIWKARALILTKEFVVARENLDFIENDKSFPKKFQAALFATYADYYLQQNNPQEAIPWLKKAIEKESSKKLKIRYTFILGQIYQELEEYPLASEMYSKVIKSNPPYEMAFNAQIRRASSFSVRFGGANNLMKELEKMLKDDKNIEYRDQIYFAMAEIEMKQSNQEKAIEYYKLSAENSVQNTNQKAASFLALANLYYKQPDYKSSQLYYDSTLFYIDPEVPDYDLITTRSLSLNRLVENLNVISREDSLQKLAKLSEAELNNVIQRQIDAILEAERKAKEEEQMAMTNAAQAKFEQNDPRNRNLAAGGKWYFYNPTAISFGQTEFIRLWGRRKLEDNWRRKNKEIILFTDESDSTQVAQGDSTIAKRPTDPKTKEFYLVDIPFTDSLVNLSNNRIMNAYFAAGEIYRDELKNTDEAIKMFEGLNKAFPKNDFLLFTYYTLYKMHKDRNEEVKANQYKSMIISNYPDSRYAQMFTNPNYLQELASKAEKARSLYELSYATYRNKQFNLVIDQMTSAEKEYPDSELMPKFTFLKALAYGEQKKYDPMVAGLKEIISKYPESEVKEPAMAILQSISRDDKLKSKVQGVILPEEKPVEVVEPEIYFVNDKVEHFFVMSVPNKTTDINRLKYQFSNFNLDYFGMQQYKVSSVILNDDLQIITVKGFLSTAKAVEYMKTILANQNFFEGLDKINYQQFIISSDNFTIFFNDKDVAKYLRFFQKNYNLEDSKK